MAFIRTRPGAYREQIIIQQAAEVANSYGELVQTWSTYAQIHAAIEPLRGREFWAGTKEQQARVTTRIRIRYLSGVTPKMRVLWGSRAYQIQAVIDPEERHIQLDLMCEEWIDT